MDISICGKNSLYLFVCHSENIGFFVLNRPGTLPGVPLSNFYCIYTLGGLGNRVKELFVH